MGFARDVFIDLLGYRNGHNEGDEPRFNTSRIKYIVQNIKILEIFMRIN
jgi:2-oxoglutarate dehydrogenase complex dehydrogenase (E1) component-like enzyme